MRPCRVGTAGWGAPVNAAQILSPGGVAGIFAATGRKKKKSNRECHLQSVVKWTEHKNFETALLCATNAKSQEIVVTQHTKFS